MPVQTQIQQRRGTAASWTSTNPTLAAGEIGFETDTNRFKIGTGSTAWASLNYWVQDPVTTKGDLYTFSTTDARLPVGANDTVLTADSSTATGLKWATSAGGGMTSIASGTLSGTSVSLTSIPGTYNDLVLRIFAFNSDTDDKSVKITLNSATGANDYVRGLAFSGTEASAGGNPDLVVLSGTDDAVLTNFIELRLPSYADSSTYQLINIQSFGADPSTTTSLKYINNAMGIYRATAAITSIQIFQTDLPSFTGGTYVLYGVK
jgi:hypothetical protein